MKEKNYIKNTLAHSAFLQVNRTLMNDLGDATATIILSLILDKHSYFEKRNELDGDTFFITKEVLMKDTGFSEQVILRAERRLIKRKYVTCHLKGLPRKKYYNIQWERILHVLQNTGAQPLESLSLNVQDRMGNDTKINETKINNTKHNKTRGETLETSETSETSLHHNPSISQTLRLAGVESIDEYFNI